MKKGIQKILDGISHAAFDALMAGIFLVVWVFPDNFSRGRVAAIQSVFQLELLAVHCGHFLGFVVMAESWRLRWFLATLLLLTYLSVFAGLTYLSQSWTPLIAGIMLVLSKVPLVKSGLSDKAQKPYAALWGGSVILWFVCYSIGGRLAGPGLVFIHEVDATEIHYTMIASGYLYFSGLAAAKFALAPLINDQGPARQNRNRIIAWRRQPKVAFLSRRRRPPPTTLPAAKGGRDRPGDSKP